jgi:hypothetical protein
MRFYPEPSESSTRFARRPTARFAPDRAPIRSAVASSWSGFSRCATGQMPSGRADRPADAGRRARVAAESLAPRDERREGPTGPLLIGTYPGQLRRPPPPGIRDFFPTAGRLLPVLPSPRPAPAPCSVGRDQGTACVLRGAREGLRCLDLLSIGLGSVSSGRPRVLPLFCSDWPEVYPPGHVPLFRKTGDVGRRRWLRSITTREPRVAIRPAPAMPASEPG